jgi:hypothetical protein
MTVADEITLELARLQREAIARVRRRIAAQQLGEAFIDLDPEKDRPAKPNFSRA